MYFTAGLNVLEANGIDNLSWFENSKGEPVKNTFVWAIFADGTPMTNRRPMTVFSLVLLNDYAVEGCSDTHVAFSLGEHTESAPETLSYIKKLGKEIEALTSHDFYINNLRTHHMFLGEGDGKMASMIHRHAGSSSKAPSSYAAVRSRRFSGDPPRGLAFAPKHRLRTGPVC